MAPPRSDDLAARCGGTIVSRKALRASGLAAGTSRTVAGPTGDAALLYCTDSAAVWAEWDRAVDAQPARVWKDLRLHYAHAAARPRPPLRAQPP